MVKKVLSCIMFLFVWFSFPVYAGEQQMVEFQYEKLNQPFEINYDYYNANQYLYELGIKYRNNCISEFQLTNDDMMKIFGKTEIKKSDLYRELLYINQAVTAVSYNYGLPSNALFELDGISCTDNSNITNPTIKISSSFRSEIFDDEILDLKKLFNEIGVDENTTQKKAISKIGSYIVNNFTYDTSIIGSNTRTIWDILKAKTGVCYDYANVFCFLSRICDIDSYYVFGDSSAGLHAWNYSIVDGDKIFTDCTWSQTSGNWIMRSEEGFTNHFPYETR